MACVAEQDRELGNDRVKELMVKIFGLLGSQSELSNKYPVPDWLALCIDLKGARAEIS